MYAIRIKAAVEPMHLAVRHLLRLGDHADDVHAEAVDPLVAPPGHHVKHFFAYPGIVPVQVRLFCGKKMQVVHAGCLVILPCRAAEAGTPVVGRRLGVFAFAPDIVIAVRVVPGLPALHKPSVFIRRMIDDQIHDDLDSAFVCGRQQRVKVRHRTKFVHNILIVADVVSVVVIGGLIHRREPDHVDPQIFQIVQPADDSLQVADAVAVAVHKAARINLINHRFFPPCSFHIVFLPFRIR